MKHLIQELLRQRNVNNNFSEDDLYKVGMDNVRQNIEFYYDKTYTCAVSYTHLTLPTIYSV